jgi:hypothetical protein
MRRTAAAVATDEEMGAVLLGQNFGPGAVPSAPSGWDK